MKDIRYEVIEAIKKREDAKLVSRLNREVDEERARRTRLDNAPRKQKEDVAFIEDAIQKIIAYYKEKITAYLSNDSEKFPEIENLDSQVFSDVPGKITPFIHISHGNNSGLCLDFAGFLFVLAGTSEKIPFRHLINFEKLRIDNDGYTHFIDLYDNANLEFTYINVLRFVKATLSGLGLQN